MPIRDPLLRELEDALDRPLDGNEFEAAMCSMLREQGIFPKIVPVRGGGDAGMDGAIGDLGETRPPTPLVCTTQEDVKANLVRSLNSYKEKKRPRRQLVFATSRKLTPLAQRELADTAKALGFTILNIYERAVVAELLYNSPRWCRDLLGITTVRPALSAFPQDGRPFFDQRLHGRDVELNWLRERTGDALIVGQPGIGKTFLLRPLASEKAGLFVVTDEVAAIDAAIRQGKPKLLLVSDAHARGGLLRALRQLRSDTGGTWQIIADCWPGAEADVRNELAIAKTDVLELRPLSRDLIVEIIRDAGILGPVRLVRELVDQARGRAGLAVTLVFLYLRGDYERVGMGKVLAEQVEATFRKLVGADAANVLTLLSLGGSEGFALSEIAKVMGKSPLDIQQLVVHLSAGGVVEEQIDYGGDRRIVVQPEALRAVLVSDRFFGKYPLELPEQLLKTAGAHAVTEVFLDAAHRGADIPDELLWTRIQESDRVSLLESYAALGREQAERVLIERPELLQQLARIGLLVSPSAYLPKLLAKAVGDSRDTNSALHPLRQVEDWVHGGQPGRDAMERRVALVESVEAWLSRGDDLDVAIRAVSLALVPMFSTSHSDAGSGRTVTLTRGVINTDEMDRLGELWDRVIDAIPAGGVKDWDPLLSSVRQVASPHTLGGDPGEAFRIACNELASHIVKRLADKATGRPGVLVALRETADWLGIKLPIEIDAMFSVIYPTQDYQNHAVWFSGACSAVNALAGTIATQSPNQIARMLEFYKTEARSVGNTGGLFHVLGESLSKIVSDPQEWIRAFIDHCRTHDLVSPLLQKLYSMNHAQWLDACRSCWKCAELRITVISSALVNENVPEELIGTVLPELPKYARLIEVLCIRGQVPTQMLRRLFCHQHDGVAAAAAVGEWHLHSREGVPSEVRGEWRTAILRCGSTEQRESIRLFPRDILASDPDLAFEWLLTRIQSGTRLIDLEHYDLDGATPELSSDQRLRLLIAIARSDL